MGTTRVKKLGLQQALGYLAAGLGGLVIGFVAGREYLKHELRTAFQSAVGDFRKDLAGLGSVSASAPQETAAKAAGAAAGPTPAPAPKAPMPVAIALINKGFKPSNPGAGDFEDDITLALSIKNLTGRNIRALDGTVNFTDLLDNEIMRMSLAINDPIAAAATLTWDGGINYNQFIDADQRLRAAQQQDLKINFVPNKILFADGSIKKYGTH